MSETASETMGVRVAPPASPAIDSETRTRRRALLALFMVAMFNYIDRTILSILQIPIKLELGLSDGQIGALTGLSFALFYTTLALPIARLADRYSRRLIVVASLALWCLMTAMSGLAAGFLSLVVFRIGVAIGEAGSLPASVSLISDYYPPRQRATAMSTFGLGLPLGLMLGYSATGWLAETVGWRYTFAIIGGLGVAFAPFALAMLKDPPRGRFDPPAPAGAIRPGMLASMRLLWRIKGFRFAVIAAMLHGFSQYSMMTWNAPFFVRLHGLSLSEVAMLMALLSGAGGAIGMYLGGVVSDRLALRDARWRLWVMAIAVGATVPFALLQYLTPSTGVSIAAAAVAALLMVVYYGPILAVTQSVVPPDMRAFSNSVLSLCFNLFGLGLGPWFTGLMSDLLAADAGMSDGALRYALSLSLLPACVSALMFVFASRYFKAGARA
jgi:predicted MFS family arabinose efflux permease